MNKDIREIIIEEYKKENNFLLNLFLVSFLLFWIFTIFTIKANDNLRKEKEKLQQQVVDYKWQLEQVQYIIECQRGE